MNRSRVTPLAFPLLAGCLWGFRAAPDTNAPTLPTGPLPTLHGWSYQCVNASPDLTTYAANVDVDAVRVTALIVESAATPPVWVEEHALDGGPIAFEVELESVGNGDDARNGRQTVFTCDRVDGLTVVWRIYGPGGLADCVAVGLDPRGVLEDLGAYDWSPDAAPTALGEVNADACRVDEGTATPT